MVRDTKLVSVIVPAYNSEKTIIRCINSILNSSYDNIELILIDDGSTDNTLALCNNVHDSRLKLIRLNHAGVANARNFGVINSRGGVYNFC